MFFYSNIFDLKREFDNAGMINVSTNFLLEKDRESRLNTSYGQLQIHRENEIFRQVYFITQSERALASKVPFELPEFITANIVNAKGSSSFFGHPDYPDMTEPLQMLKEELKQEFSHREYNQSENNKESNGGVTLSKPEPFKYSLEDVQLFVWILMIDHFIYEIYNMKLKAPDFERIAIETERLERWGNRKASRQALDFFASFATDEAKNESIDERLTGLARNIVKFCRTLRRLLRKSIDEFRFDGERLSFNIKVSNKGELYELIKYYGRTIINSSDYMTFDWRDLSSGQKALLTLYSRFYYFKSKKELDKDVIILIDEGEVYFHPQWQKELIRNLIDFFSYLFCSQTAENQPYKIQLIMTSNSPFVISDLPSSNIVFLKKSDQSTIVLDGLEDMPATFASNIHSLLAHTFFLQDGSIGLFARDKINHVIHVLVNKSTEEVLQNKDILEKTIRVIGEPLIRNKMLQMLEERMIYDLLSVRSEMDVLKRRLDRLENRDNR
jgi:hypothetical protein